MFQPVQGDACIIYSKGVYKQCDIYEWDGYLYAKTLGGFIGLFADGSTTKADAQLKHISWTHGVIMVSRMRLCRVSVEGSKPLPNPTAVKLLGAPLPTPEEMLERLSGQSRELDEVNDT